MNANSKHILIIPLHPPLEKGELSDLFPFLKGGGERIEVRFNEFSSLNIENSDVSIRRMILPNGSKPYRVETRKGMNLLEALLRIQDEQDGTLAFRYSCRGAVCGSCAMRVNGKVVLACRTHVEDLFRETNFRWNLFPISRLSGISL